MSTRRRLRWGPADRLILALYGVAGIGAVWWLREVGYLVLAIQAGILLTIAWTARLISLALMEWLTAVRCFLGLGARRVPIAESDGFYSSPQWMRLRSIFWRVADHATEGQPRCMYCGNLCDQAHREHASVDHIKPRKTHPHLALDLTNLGPACQWCNSSKGARRWSSRFTIDPRIEQAAREFIANGMRKPRHWRRRST